MSDTSEITNGCLVHYDSSHIQTRRDFMGICLINEALFEDKPKEKPNQECMAKILRIMETLTDHAKTQWKLAALQAKEKGLDIPPEPKEFPLELANSAIVSLIYGTFAESMVRNSLDYLVALGYLKRYQKKSNSTPIYWLQLPYIQTLLEQQAKARLAGCDFKPPHMQGVISNPKPLKSKGKRAKSHPSPANSKGVGFESTDNNNYSNTGDTSSDTKETEESAGSGEPDAAGAIPPENMQQFHAAVKSITEGRIPAVRPAEQQGGGAHGQRVAPSQQTTSPVLPPGDMATPASQPTTGAASASPRSEPRRGNGKADPLADETARILDDWDSLFKSPAARTDKHIEAARKLAPCHPSKADLKACKGWLFTTDDPKRPWYRKKGVSLTDIAEKYGAWQSVNDQQEPEKPKELTPEERLKKNPYDIGARLALQEQQRAQARAGA